MLGDRAIGFSKHSLFMMIVMHRKALLVILVIFSIFIVAFYSFYIYEHESIYSTVESHTLPSLSSSISEGLNVVKIIVIVDNNVYRSGLKTAWGIAVYVETPYTKFLFDTGPNPSVLEYNAKVLGINLSSIDFVVLSHVHGDHTGGLPLIARLKPCLKVYIPAHVHSLGEYVRNLGLEPVLVNKTMEIASGVYVSKPLYGPPHEISVAISTSNGLFVLVGCSHCGVDNFVKTFIEDTGYRVYGVLGGFHLSGSPIEKVRSVIDNLVEQGVSKIYPIHCSGDNTRDYVRTSYPDCYGDGGVGLEIVLNP